MAKETTYRRITGTGSGGFTLVELLVVISILGILAALILPALAHAKTRAMETACLNNQKQLALAFMMYAADNSDELLQYNLSQPNNGGGFWGLDSKAPGSWTSQSAALADVQGCLQTNNMLWQYAPNTEVYHCPSDPRVYLHIGAGNAIGWAYDSYAITENVESLPGWNDSFLKMPDISRPSDCMTFTEQADTRGYNKGTFALSVTATTAMPIGFVDVFSSYHGPASTFAFADGHAERHEWSDPGILTDAQYAVKMGSGGYDYPNCPVQPNQKGADAAWIIQHCVSPTNP